MPDDLFSWTPPGGPPPPPDPYLVMDCHGKIVPRDVVKMFDEMALKMANTGRPRYSVRMITSVMCWHRHLEYADRPFKINHNWTSAMSRWWLKRHPEYPDFFETRDRTEDGYDEAAA